MGCAAIVQVDHNYTEAELFDIGYEQAADVMILTHLNHTPRALRRYAHDDWRLEDITFASQAPPPTNLTTTANKPNTVDPYEKEVKYIVTAVNDERGEESVASNLATATIDLSLRGNSVVLEWDAVTGASSYNVYKGYHDVFGFVGTSGPETAFTDDNILPDYSDGPPQHRNPFIGAGNYPAGVTFYEQRAFYFRTLNRPNAFWGSQSSLFFNMNVARPVGEADALAGALNARKVNAILHMVPLKDLIVFTTDAIWKLSGSENFLSPTNLNVTPQGYRGASRVRPVPVDEVIFYNSSRGATIRTLNFEFEVDGYRGNDITVFCPHLFKRVKVVDMAWAEYPTQTLYVVCDDGRVRALTWQAEQQVWGWSLLHTDGFFESVCVISEGGEDRPYFIVRRQIKRFPPATPEWRRYMERGASYLWSDVKEAIYLDSAKFYEGEPEDTFVNLMHLEGCHVRALVDGAVYSNDKNRQPLVVKNGSIVLPAKGSKVVIGLPYESWARTLPLSAGQSRGRPKTIGEVIVSVDRTRGAEVGHGKDVKPDPMGNAPDVLSLQSADEIVDDGFVIKSRGREAPGVIPPLFTGDYTIAAPTGNLLQASLVIRQRNPLPMHVNGLAYDVQLGGDALL